MSKKRSTAWSANVESVYRTLGRELWALFYAHCCDADRAYDALQEAFVRLQEQQDGPPIHDVRAWLLRVGRNWLHDAARRKNNSVRTSEHLDQLAGSQLEPHSILAGEELHTQVRTALEQLRPDDREILVLKYSMGWSSNRIADVLTITASAVDMRLSRARRRLAKILETAGVGHEQN